MVMNDGEAHLFPEPAPEAVELTDDLGYLLIKGLRRGLFGVCWRGIYTRKVDSIDIVHR